MSQANYQLLTRPQQSLPTESILNTKSHRRSLFNLSKTHFKFTGKHEKINFGTESREGTWSVKSEQFRDESRPTRVPRNVGGNWTPFEDREHVPNPVRVFRVLFEYIEKTWVDSGVEYAGSCVMVQHTIVPEDVDSIGCWWGRGRGRKRLSSHGDGVSAFWVCMPLQLDPSLSLSHHSLVLSSVTHWSSTRLSGSTSCCP